MSGLAACTPSLAEINKARQPEEMISRESRTFTFGWEEMCIKQPHLQKHYYITNFAYIMVGVHLDEKVQEVAFWLRGSYNSTIFVEISTRNKTFCDPLPSS